jgi:peptide-methionine (S)-S-oxide reductase
MQMSCQVCVYSAEEINIKEKEDRDGGNMKDASGTWIVFGLTIVMVGFAAWSECNWEMMEMSKKKGAAMDTAIFGAGCFWGVEETFRRVKGVTETRVGYTGGTTDNPTYEQVCAGFTGHTEAVEVTFDPAMVSYEELLTVFWELHNPAQHKKTQYKSVIFYATRAQKAAAEASKAALEQAGQVRGHIETEILPAATFWPAEQYHQQYYRKHGGGACAI